MTGRSWVHMPSVGSEKSTVFVASVLCSRTQGTGGMHTHTRPTHSCSSLVKATGCRFILQGSGEEQALPLCGPHPASGPSDSPQLMSLNTSSPLSSFCWCWVINITGASGECVSPHS